MPSPACFDLKALRRAAIDHGDTSAAAIARRLGMPYGTVIRWTSGRAAPSGPALAAIERAYGLTPAQLYPADA
ncbi:helix-turn-helix transcriptional regulator [Streptomyces sp. NPDC005908]|uniref:helix-turn-helix domain-containing protein n=1 Tax=Streptomyces sp. NPDC005908 TaxID=3157084 RepID=UPI0033E4F5B2